ncbi:MAG: PliI family lysozyme inhibitor of I-type lysozyme [Cyclobacteriaceae bacterium]|jgi:biopolymer transport protein ExbD
MIGKNLLFVVLIIFYLAGCNQTSSRKSEDIPSNEELEAQTRNLQDTVAVQEPGKYTIENIEGNYVSEGYLKREEGYDWVAVTITAIGTREAYIRIRSRADRKKPTCTYDGIGTIENNGVMKVDFDGKNILFIGDNNVLRITTENEDQEDFLMYFCSGGGNLAGTYKKLEDPLDEKQLKPSGFNKSLSLQGVTFKIHASEQGSINILTIQPSGLEIDNRMVAHKIDGNVTDAEIEDLNSDGSPEVLVYITSAGSGSYGSVIGYSVNNRQSMSQIYFPPISDNPEISEGYMGHDEFAIIETTFARRFPIYKEGDTNSNPTGGIRQVQYKLHDGEASRIFKVEKVVEFDN